jgi:hypothetical protein
VSPWAASHHAYLGEVARQVVLLLLRDLAEHVVEEDRRVVLDVLVVQEEFRQEGQVLAVDRVLQAVHLEHRDPSLGVAVDLVSGGVPEGTADAVPKQLGADCVEAEAELAEVEGV